MTAPTDSSVSAKEFLHGSHFFSFFLFLFPFNIDNCKYGSLFRKGINMKFYLLFTIIYPKITMNTVKTISQWQ